MSPILSSAHGEPIRVLLVEDDPQISKSLLLSLSFSGYEVSTAETISQAWARMENMSFDLLLLDVGLPDGSGIDLCQKIRLSGKNVPIIFLSARTDEDTVVKGMRFGGDDYIRKPFGTEELKVRIGKILKRSDGFRNVLEAGPLLLDIDKRIATVFDRPLALGKREFSILTILAKKSGDVVTRASILVHLDENPETYDRTIDSHMSHLRRKIKNVAGDALQIVPIYGVGYRLQWKI